jgi:hypothetical protein
VDEEARLRVGSGAFLAGCCWLLGAKAQNKNHHH